MQFLGYPYVYGGSSPRGFDCSGFTSYIYKQFGVSIHRTASGQLNNGYAVSFAKLKHTGPAYLAAEGRHPET